MESAPSGLTLLATITSRNEALVVASALEHAGIHVFVDAEWHASVDPISVALGGHRIRVFEGQWAEASAIVREIGLDDAAIIYHSHRKSVLRLLAVLYGYHTLWLLPAFAIGALPLSTWFWALITIPVSTPVDPRGPNEYYLAKRESKET